MIERSQITTLAVKWQTTELNVAREYLQHRFLNFFYKQEKSGKILFKGGTALRLIFNSPRFSEDLDFTAFQIGTSEIEGIIINTLHNLSGESLVGEIKEADKTSGGYLALANFQIYNFGLSVRLEISLKEQLKRIQGEFAQISSMLAPPYSLWHLNAEQLIKEKIKAALERAKPRDFFDVYFLLRARLISPKDKPLIKKLPPLLKKADINFSSELKTFLPTSSHPIIKNFNQTLLKEIERA